MFSINILPQSLKTNGLHSSMYNKCMGCHEYFKFFVTGEAIRQWYWTVTMSAVHPSWKWLPNRLMSEKKMVFNLTHTSFHFLHTILCPDQAHKPTKTLLILPFSPRMVFSDLALCRQHSSIHDVIWMQGTGAYWSIVLACANWNKGDHH